MSAACPICSKPVVAEFRPFCSKRCADVDLARWLGEGYRISTPASAEDEQAIPTPNDEDLPKH